MTAYYNEFDPFAAEWLRELIKAGHIADGEVDERSIEDVLPNDLVGFTQCHFFAGIGVWSHALRKAGWSDDKPVWTASCPCQPFSTAGKGDGFDDERPLWPHLHWLIENRRPSVVFGEQVASKDGLAWIDLVQTDLEGSGYTSGAVDTCAAGFGAPHIRQRLYWVAYADRQRRAQHAQLRQDESGRNEGNHSKATWSGEADRLADTESERRCVFNTKNFRQADAPGNAPTNASNLPVNREQQSAVKHPSPTNGFWRDADWLFCRDGKWRPVEPGTFPLAHGAPARVGRLRGYGNAIVAPQAIAFIQAFMDIQ